MRKRLFIFILGIFGYIFGYSQYSVCGLTPTEALNNTLKCLVEQKHIGQYNEKALKRITDIIGIAPNFTFKHCGNTKNAGAIINPFQDNARYIVYDGLHFDNLYNRDKYSFYFILAHEIAHHLNGHTIPTTNNSIQENHKKELEADYFAGFIMFKLGAKEEDIIRTINKFPNPTSDYDSHPRNEKRLKSALKGFMDEEYRFKDEFSSIAEFVKKDIKKEQDVLLFNELVDNINKYTTGQEKYLDIAEYIISKLDNNNPTIIKLKAYVNYKNKKYDLAYPYYKDVYLAAKDETDLEILLDILHNIKKSDTFIDNLLNNYHTINNPKTLLSLGIYSINNSKPDKALLLFEKAYQLVKNESDDILKSDILYHYGRLLLEDKIIKGDKGNLDFVKLLLIKAKRILDRYPDDDFFRIYYNQMLFHLGNVQKIDNDYYSAIKTYEELLSRETIRKDFIYKVNASLYEIYMDMENYQRAIKHITLSINANNEDIDHKSTSLLLRAKIYATIGELELAKEDIESACKLGYSKACESKK